MHLPGFLIVLGVRQVLSSYLGFFSIAQVTNRTVPWKDEHCEAFAGCEDKTPLHSQILEEIHITNLTAGTNLLTLWTCVCETILGRWSPQLVEFI